MNKFEHKIKSVMSGSIAEEMGIETGDILLSIDNQQIEDVFDYLYLTADDYFVMLIKKSNSEEWELEIDKDYDEKIGLVFENELMSNYKSCYNNCIFCFVSQMPVGMRETLYFKDDDYRLSILQGNFITLTNLAPHDVDRIIKYRLEPLNISIHTMNKELRCDMLCNRFAGESLKILDRLKEAGLSMNTQIVLCKDYNDKDELRYSLELLYQYLPYVKSLSIVPVGLSQFREQLTHFDPFNKDDALEVINLVEEYQDKASKEHGFHFVHASDEWYALAEKSVPEHKRYDDFTQLENGVGMLRLLHDEAIQALEMIKANDKDIIKNRTISIATGTLAYPYINELVDTITAKIDGIKVNVYSIVNNYFGRTVTVAGLITGEDLINQLKGRDLGEKMVIPINMLRSGERVFLDNTTVEDIEKSLDIRIEINDSDGKSFVDHLLYDDDSIVRNNESVGYIDAYDSYNKF